MAAWSSERAMFVQVKAEGGTGGAFDAVDRDFAVALRGVSVAGREQCAGVQDGKIKSGAAREFTDVHIAAEDPRRTRAELAVFRGGDAHHATEGPERNYGRN